MINIRDTDILLIIDAQKGFCAEAPHSVINGIEVLQNFFSHVYASKFTNTPHSFFEKHLHWRKMGYTDPGHDLAIDLNKDAIVFEKFSYTCVTHEFPPHNIHDSRIFICGFDTDQCVIKTAMDLIEAGYHPVLIKDLCWTKAGEAANTAAINAIGRAIGKQNVIARDALYLCI